MEEHKEVKTDNSRESEGGQTKNAYEEKKLARQKERQVRAGADKRQKHTQTIIRLIVLLVILSVLGYIFYAAVRKELPRGEDLSQFFEGQGGEHIESGAEHPLYSSNPPTGGPHYTTPAPVGFYSKPLPDERIIHNLEHGDIWIAYHPRVSEKVVALLRAFESDAKVIITPREANEFDVSLASWERLDNLTVLNNTIDSERIANFIKRYRNRSPEKVNQPRVDGSGPAQIINPHGQ